MTEQKNRQADASRVYWRDVTEALGAEGPSPVPDGLAARVAARAMAHVPTPTLLDELVRLAKPAAGVAWLAAAGVLIVASVAGRAGSSRPSSSTEAPTVDVVLEVTSWDTGESSWARQVLGGVEVER